MTLSLPSLPPASGDTSPRSLSSSGTLSSSRRKIFARTSTEAGDDGAPRPRKATLPASRPSNRGGSSPSAPSAYDALVWGQVEGGDEPATKRSPWTLRRRNTGPSRVEAGAANDDETAAAAAAAPLLPLKRGHMLVVLEWGHPLSLGCSGGAVGRFDRASIRPMDPAASPRSPAGDAPPDWTKLLQCLAARNFALLPLLLETAGTANTARVTASLLELLRLAPELLESRAMIQHLIHFEVAHTSEHQLLFRGNTVASKVLSQYARTAGSAYLELLLRPLLRSTILAAHDTTDFKDAPSSRASKGSFSNRSVPSSPVTSSRSDSTEAELATTSDDAEPQPGTETSEEEQARKEKNAQTAQAVWRSTEIVMDALLSSFDSIPAPLRRTAFDIYSAGSAKFADYYPVLAGFFVLRFIAPAIAAPDPTSVGTLSADAMKRLLQVSKVVQAIANRQPFKDGTHLAVLNPVVLAAADQLRAFFDRFKVDPSPAGGPAAGGHVGPGVSVADLDPVVMRSCWTLFLHSLPAMARKVEMLAPTAPEYEGFIQLVDCLSGLPLSKAK